MELSVNYDEISPARRKMVREEYYRIQNGKCHYCNNDLNSEPSKTVKNKMIMTSLFPPNFFKWPVHLHHNHDTGMTIGAVHARCNAVL